MPHAPNLAHAELADLSDAERTEALASCGLSSSQVEEVATLMAALPSIQLRAVCEMPGEDEIMEGDPARCKVRGADRGLGRADEGMRCVRRQGKRRE